MIRSPNIVQQRIAAWNGVSLTMVCCEISILLANVLKLASYRVYNLNVASHIFVSPDFAEVVEARRF